MSDNKHQISAKEKRREKIILSALKVFCEKGFHSTTVDDIVKKAKCSHGLFYHYFNSKKELFEEVSSLRGKGMMTYLEEVVNMPTNYLEKLKNLTDYAFSNIKKDELFAYKYYFFVSTMFNKAESGKLHLNKGTPPHVKMNAFFEQGINNGDFTNKYPAFECAKLYNSIIQGATLCFILCPKEYKKHFTFPSTDFILDVFKKKED